MERGFLGRIIDRVLSNARVIRGAPEAIVLVGIIAAGVSYVALQHFHREHVGALNDRIASQERLLADYRSKLRGATPDEAATQIENLTSLLAETQKGLSEAKSKLVSADKRSRDSRRLYEDNNPIALIQDPKVDLDTKRITFPVVSAAAILETNKVYEFQSWRVMCGGGTKLYNMINDGAAPEFSYSPLTCKIVGNR